MVSTLLRVSFTVARVTERYPVAQAVREVGSLTDRLYVMRHLCLHVPAVPLAVLTQVLIPAQHHCRPPSVLLRVVLWVERHTPRLPYSPR